MEKSEGKKEVAPEPVLKYRKYSYASAQGTEFKSKQDLFTHYLDQRKESLVQAHKKMSDLINKFNEKYP